MNVRKHSKSGPPGSRRGFTLMETAMATVIVGVAVVATCELLATGTTSNIDATELTTGVNLANNIHEIMVDVPFVDPNAPTSTSYKEASVATYAGIWAFNGDTYSPPLDVKRNAISSYPNWSQSVTVQTAAANQVNSARPNDITVPTAKVTVTIKHNGHFVYQTSWLEMAADPP
ncbi:MAG TPA: prepilin-type N-terminal cleavage/methylation domain-containing protein [Tepidisphaeraceae bacterium]|nr:prepilin-type N-terminal cleavage/methylation domain-containing protein [Tepidisphaeraceae bacterium]